MILNQMPQISHNASIIKKFRYACDRQTNSDLSAQFNALALAEINAGAPTNLTELRNRITPLKAKYAEIAANEKKRQDFINNSFFVMRQIYRLANWIFSLFKSYVPNPTFEELNRVMDILDPVLGYGIKIGLYEGARRTFVFYAKPMDREFEKISFSLFDEADGRIVGDMYVSLSEKQCLSIYSIKTFQYELENTDKEKSPTVLHLMTQVAIEIFYRSAFATMEITTHPNYFHGPVRITEEDNIIPKLLLKEAGFKQSSPETSSKRLNQSIIFSISKGALLGGRNTVFYTRSHDGLETDVMVKRDWRSDWANDDGKYQRSWESVIAKTPILTGAGPVLPE